MGESLGGGVLTGAQTNGQQSPGGRSGRHIQTYNHPRSDRRAQFGGDVVVETILKASRAMALMAETSVHQESADVTPSQYRTLVLLAAQGPSRLAELSKAMGVNPSTATRMCDRLVRKSLMSRLRDEVDRREIVLDLTEEGRALVEAVTAQRRVLVEGIMRSIPVPERAGLVRSLELLTTVVNQATTEQWQAGWSPD